jgi:pimeloyl-ACP methyl ester carboxylesterase
MPWRETPEELARARAERAFMMAGPRGQLIGIYTPPAPEVAPADLCVVMLSRPRFEHRRMTVQAARRLAVNGFGCLRFDQNGWGESEGEDLPINPEKPRQYEALHAIKYARENLGHTRFVMWGACLDGLSALSAFDGEAAAIEGLIIMSSPVTRLPASDVYTWHNMTRWALDPERWRQVLFSGSTRKLARRAIKIALRGTLGRALGDDKLAVSFQQNFDLLVKSRACALFLYGTEDEEYKTFQVAQEHLFTKLDAATCQRLKTEIWPGRVHSVLDVERQQEVVERAVNWVLALHPSCGLEGAVADRA